MRRNQLGFTLIELIAIIILLGILAVNFTGRLGVVPSSSVQSSRDDIIAALFFAQQTAMARGDVQVTVSAGSIDVKENGTSIKLNSDAYPLTFPAGVTATDANFIYNKLGETTLGSITINQGAVSTTITVEATGYAHY